ncbi:MAG: hypothetical protein COA79_07050 [Planctomycetota bacterium]|nr:MAG: hypothetical protein COA79_07050 [Planctomycetota bacterium]
MSCLKKIGLLSCLTFSFMFTLVADDSVPNIVKKDSTVADVKTVPPPPYWDHFLIMIWQFRHSVAKEYKNYEKVNIHGFHIDRSNKKLAALSKEKKWLFYVDHAADKGFLHLSKSRGKFNVNFKSGKLQQRPNCLVDPKTLDAMKGYLKKNINNAKDAYPVGYSLDDEISIGSFCSAVELDNHPLSIADYRRFLKRNYDGDIKKLNKQYGSDYKEFGEIKPVTFHKYYPLIESTNLHEINLSHWCDWRSYMDTQFADCLKKMTHYANSLDPKRPTGFVGGQGPTAFGGYNWRKLSKSAQWCEAYESGGNNEIIRSFWGQKRPLLKTFFPRTKTSGHIRNVWFLWYYMVHGNRGVIVWPANFFKDGGVAPHVERLAPTFKEVQGPMSKLIVDSEFQYDDIAIYYSHPSIQITWCLDADSHKETWPNRKSSMDNNLSTSHLTRMGWHKGLEDIGFQPRYIHKDHLLGDFLTKEKVKVLILNRTLALSDAEIIKITDFVKNGGTVIADHMTGIYDRHGKARKKGALNDLFGISRDLSKGILNGKTTTEVDGEIDWGRLSNKNYIKGTQFNGVNIVENGIKATTGKAMGNLGGKEYMIVKNTGKGKTIFMNLSTIGYYKIRGKRDKGSGFRSFLSKLMTYGGVTRRITLKENGKAPYILESLFWKKDGKNVLAIVRNPSMGSSIYGKETSEGDIGKEKLKVTITFDKPVMNFVNARTKKKFKNGKKFVVEFVPFEAGLFTYD